MKITNPALEVVRFNADDVIATSLYYMSAADYNAYAEQNDLATVSGKPYVYFNGDMTYVDGTSWKIENIHSVGGQDDLGMFTGFSWGGTYFPPMKQGYEAYSYNGELYTKGATYLELKGQ